MAKIDRNRNPRRYYEQEGKKKEESEITLPRFLKYGLLCSIPFLLIALIIGFVPVSTDDGYEEQPPAPSSELGNSTFPHDDAVVLFPRILGQLSMVQDSLQIKSGIKLQIVTTPAVPDGIDAYARLAMNSWNVPASSKAALLVYAPAHRKHKLVFSPALAATIDTLQARRIVDDGFASSPKDPNGAVLAAVETFVQMLDPANAGPIHSWDPNATDSADYRKKLESRPAPLNLVDPNKPVPAPEAPFKQAHPGTAILFFLVVPMMLLTCWKVVVASSYNWILLPICVTILYAQFSAPLAIVTGIVAFVSLVGSALAIHGSSGE